MNFSKRPIYILMAAALMLALAVYLKFSPSSRMVEKTAFYMGTFVQIKVPVASETAEITALNAIYKAFEEIARIEGVFSVFKEDSEISRINAMKAGEPMQISDETFALIERSIDFNKKTAGAFDITVKPLVDLWRTAAHEKKLPSEESVRSALLKVGSDYIVLDQLTRTITFQREGMAIDMGGVAKGYATDRAVAVLEANGIKDAIVNSGGDMYCLGKKTKINMWRVGIQHPRDKSSMAMEIELKDAAIVTSGDYEKYFILYGKRYSHIIDPRTGYPAGDDIVSATVISPDSATSDILATALCVLGKKGIGIAEAVEGADAIIISETKGGLKVMTTSGIDKRYAITKKCRFIN